MNTPRTLESPSASRTRENYPKISAIAGGLALAAFAAHNIAGSGETTEHTPVVKVVTAEQLGVSSIDGIIKKECPTLDDKGVQKARNEIDGVNLTIASNAHQIAPDSPVNIPVDLCEVSK